MRVLLFGTFDYLHPGHQYVINEARKRGEVFVVVARDVTVERVKKRPPAQSESERLAAIRESFPDVQVLLGDTRDYLVPIRAVRPDLLLLGYDQQLPPGVTEADLGVAMERLPAHEPHLYKSSIRRAGK